jgi:predicted flap endonuclease-1-like 5' DNA nuclease
MGQNDTSGFSCKTVCWLGALIAGVLVAALLMAMRDFGFLAAVFWGLVILLVGGFVLNWAFCGKSEEHVSSAPASSETGATTSADSMATATPLASTGDATVSSATAAATPAAAVSSAPKAKAAAKPKAAPKAKAATAKPAAKEKAAPKAKTAAAKPAAKAKAAPKAKTAAAAKPVAADGKPELLKKARAGGADDLKQIKGVGPKLEGALHTMGVFHFDQIASWRKKEVEWADDNLDGVKGRVSRDEWVKQAKVLAKGGQTEFSQKVKKGGVY